MISYSVHGAHFYDNKLELAEKVDGTPDMTGVKLRSVYRYNNPTSKGKARICPQSS